MIAPATITSDGPDAALGGVMGGFAQAEYFWGNAETAYLVPFWVRSLARFRYMACITGAGATGSIDMGVYDRNGVRLASTGSQTPAAPGLSRFALTSTLWLPPGTYYMAMVSSLATTPVQGWSIAVGSQRVIGLRHAFSAFPLPATLTVEQPFGGIYPTLALSDRLL